jgi:hypothetical protein
MEAAAAAEGSQKLYGGRTARKLRQNESLELECKAEVVLGMEGRVGGRYSVDQDLVEERESGLMMPGIDKVVMLWRLTVPSHQ